YMQAHSHAQNIYITSSDNLNQEFRTLQSNSYDAITQETFFSPQSDLNFDYTEFINNQDTTNINSIDNTSLLSYNNFLFPKNNRVAESFLSTGSLNSDDYYVHDQCNGMQLFYIDSIQNNSPAQNIHVISSEYFNNSNQNQQHHNDDNADAIIQETFLPSRAAI
ncbi:9247_t:CDS:1, partial [Racocetra fulgida]